MRQALKIFLFVIHLVLADAVVKEISLCSFSVLHNGVRYSTGEAFTVIPGLFDFRFVGNHGCAWGLFQGYVWPLALFSIVAFALLVWKRRSVFGIDSPGWRGKAGRIAEILIYAGIFGNLLDRVIRGYVVDMFDFHLCGWHFPCFNLADTYITFAAAILILLSFSSGATAKSPANGRAGVPSGTAEKSPANGRAGVPPPAEDRGETHTRHDPAVASKEMSLEEKIAIVKAKSAAKKNKCEPKNGKSE